MTEGVRMVMIRDRCRWTCGSEVSDASGAPGSTRFRAQRALMPYTVTEDGLQWTLFRFPCGALSRALEGLRLVWRVGLEKLGTMKEK